MVFAWYTVGSNSGSVCLFCDVAQSTKREANIYILIIKQRAQNKQNSILLVCF